jgi:2'-5' RNA ligase
MYTLWLLPDKETYYHIASLIDELNSVDQKPRFYPHVTLLSGITDNEEMAIQKSILLSANFNSIHCQLTGIDHLEYFYKCLFFKTSESEALLTIRKSAESLFEHSQINPFIPHISFLYGSLPVFKQQAIVEKLGKDILKSVALTKLQLVQTDLTPEEWKVVKSFDLKP